MATPDFPSGLHCVLGISDRTLSAFHDDALRPDEAARLATHVETCPACRERLSTFATLSVHLRSERAPEPDARLWQSVASAVASPSSRHTPLARTGHSRRKAARPVRPSLNGLRAIAAVLLVTVGFVALSILHHPTSPAQQTATATTSPVVGWRTIASPWGAAASNSVDQYVVSRDVAGLIVACYGQSTTPPSQGLSGTAHLWRTRDGGAQWQALSATLPLDSCGSLTFISGSSGLLVTFSTLEGGGNGAGTIFVSPDAGDTWKTVTSFLPNEVAANRFTAMQQAVYRDGKLYASLIFNAFDSRLFSVSDDDGATWTVLDRVPTPAPGDEPVLTEQFAPDYSAPHAWFRYAEHGSLNASLPHSTTLDRSTDDGHTWTAINTLNANGALLPQYSSRPLVTSPSQPSRLCVGVQIPDLHSLVALPGDDLVLGASDDGGMTWHYTRVSHVQEDGRTGDPEPLMDAQGNCYVSVAPQDGQHAAVPSISADSTIYRLAPGSAAQPEVIATVAGRVAGVVAIFPGSQPNYLTLWVIATSVPTGGGTADYSSTSLLVDSVPA